MLIQTTNRAMIIGEEDTEKEGEVTIAVVGEEEEVDIEDKETKTHKTIKTLVKGGTVEVVYNLLLTPTSGNPAVLQFSNAQHFPPLPSQQKDSGYTKGRRSVVHTLM